MPLLWLAAPRSLDDVRGPFRSWLLARFVSGELLGDGVSGVPDFESNAASAGAPGGGLIRVSACVRGRPTSPEADPPLTARSRRLLTVWAVWVAILAARAFWRGVVMPSPSVVVTSCLIDVNKASVAELQGLPGVGPERAEAIVLERIRGGPFVGIRDLGRVHGFGPVLLRRLRPYVQF